MIVLNRGLNVRIYLPGSNGESVNIFLHPCCVINAMFERDQSSSLYGEDEREECLVGGRPIRKFCRADYNGH